MGCLGRKVAGFSGGGGDGRSALLPLLAVDWDGIVAEGAGAGEVVIETLASARDAGFGGSRCGIVYGWAGGMVEYAG